MSLMDEVDKAIKEDKKTGKRRFKGKSNFNKAKFGKLLEKTFKPKSKNM